MARFRAQAGPLPQAKDYRAEFRELGVDKVRDELALRRWHPEKLSAARVWVENQDNSSWMADRSDAPPSDKKKNFRKWAVYIAVAFGLAYAIARVGRSLF